MHSDSEFPSGSFDRIDPSDDRGFYQVPRFVTHIDPETIAALTDVYREVLPAGADVLDLMSSWVSHLPEEVAYGSVTGLGMNGQELEANPRLTEHRVQDLNREPELPFEDTRFDAVINAVSIQYLTRPVEVFRSAARVLRPGGLHLVAMSHRCFPTKAIRAFHTLDAEGRREWVSRYFEQAGGYETAQWLDRSPGGGVDPLWIVLARRR